MDEYFDETDSEDGEESNASEASLQSESEFESSHESQVMSKSVSVSPKPPPQWIKQVSRLEVKVNQIYDLLVQLQRMTISTKIGASEGPDKSHVLSELPLQTVDSLNKFESALGTVMYRKEVVKNLLFLHLPTHIW